MMGEIEEDLLQDLQWNGKDLKRREELSNHFSLQIPDLLRCSSKLPQQDFNRVHTHYKWYSRLCGAVGSQRDQTRGPDPDWKLKVGQTSHTWRPTDGILTFDPATTYLTNPCGSDSLTFAPVSTLLRMTFNKGSFLDFLCFSYFLGR